MRALVLRTVVISAAVLAGAPACASDNGSSAKPEPDAGAETGAHEGSGGKATGGAGGSGAAGASSGGAGAGGAPGGCDTSSCDQLVSSFSALGIKSCCVSKTQCGIDVGSFFGGGGGGTQCVDPTAFTPPGTTPPNVTVLDGGIVPVQGGLPIQLDPTCPGIVAQGAFDMPGCCRPSTGTCGGSTHTLSGAGDTVPLYCASYDEIASAAASTFGNMVVVPDDPNIKCKYTAAPTGIPDSGAAGIDAGTTDAGTGGAAGGGGTAGGGAGTSGVAGSGGTAESGGTAGNGGTGGTAGAGGTAGTAGSGEGGTAGTASGQ